MWSCLRKSLIDRNFEEYFLVGGAADGGRQGEKEARGRAADQKILFASVFRGNLYT